MKLRGAFNHALRLNGIQMGAKREKRDGLQTTRRPRWKHIAPIAQLKALPCSNRTLIASNNRRGVALKRQSAKDRSIGEYCSVKRIVSSLNTHVSCLLGIFRQFPFMKKSTGSLTRRVLGLNYSAPGAEANRNYCVIYNLHTV